MGSDTDMPDAEIPPPTHPASRGRMREVLLTAVPIVGTVAACLAVYAYAGSHRVLPGYTGCRLVRDLQSRVDCVAHVLRADIAHHGRARAATTLRRRAGRVGAIQAACHLAWHEIGAADGRRALARGTPLRIEHLPSDICAQGYSHGFTIVYLGRSPRPTVIRDAASLCSSQSRDWKDFANCMHSVGHALRTGAGNVRSVADCEASLPADARGLPPGPPGQQTRDLALQDCARGVFMQQVMEDLRAHRHPSLTHDPCSGDLDRLDDLGRTGCYAFLPTRARMLGGTSTDAARACGGVHDVRDATTCIDSYVTADTSATCGPLGAHSTLRRECDRLLAQVRKHPPRQ